MLTMAVKPGQGSGLARLIEEKHIPVLEKFAGYRDQMSMLSADGKQAILMSFWDSAAQAEAYVREGYPHVLAATDPFIESTPVLSTYDMIFSSAYPMHAAGA
jgi:hypothetical protein